MHPLHPEDHLPFDQTALGAISSRLSRALFETLPALRPYAHMAKSGEADGLSLVLAVSSPTGDADRTLAIWVDETGCPSLGFGPGHIHTGNENSDIAEIIDTAQAILDGKLVIVEDMGGITPGHMGWLDLRLPNGVEEYVTSPYSSGQGILKSWPEGADRRISLDMPVP